MRVVNALFMIVILATGAFADTTWVSDTVSGTWTSAGNPYILTADCYVADGESLFIEEGVRIINTTGTLVGNGRLVMEGSSSNPIYVTGVRITTPFKVKYCIIESCSVGLDAPDSVISSIIRYCGKGINGYHYVGPVVSSIIHNCEYGIWIYNEGCQAFRTLFHHNDYAVFIDGEDGFPEQGFYYCTFESNDNSYRGYRNNIHPWSESHSIVYFYDCLICDPFIGEGSKHVINSSYYSSMSSEYFYLPFYSEYHGLNPCFVDTSSCDYRLDSLSPYIDMGIRTPPDTFFGSAPDLGAFETDYTNSMVWIKRLTDEITYPGTPIGDTTILNIRVQNYGSVSPDSVLFIVEEPFFISSLSDSGYTPHEIVNIYIGFSPVDCSNLEDTVSLHWFYGSEDSALFFPVNGNLFLTGAISGTLSVECSPYELAGSIFVPIGETLFIEPGVKIWNITGSQVIDIYGTIIAEGTLEDSIYFGPNLDLKFKTNPDTSFFANCIFNNAPIVATNTKLAFSGCVFSGGHTCIITDSVFSSFTDCEFSNNSATLSPAGSFENSQINLNECKIHDNYTYAYCTYYHSGDCLEWGINPGTMKFTNCDIEMNACTMANNAYEFHHWYSYGEPLRGIYFVDTDAIIVNSFMAEKNSTAYGTTCDIRYINTIFDGYHYGNNYALNCILSSTFQAEMHNCLVPPGTSLSDSTGVIFGTPTFISDSSYMLAPTSIGIDMGAEYAVTDSGDTIWAPATDFYGNPRPSGTRFDIGAAEYQWEDYSPTYHCYSGWNLVSNPLAGTHFMTELLDSIDSPLFGYNNETGYYYETIMRQGSGYWVLISDENTTEIPSDVIDAIDITLSRGWNLIGGPGGPVDLSPLLSSESIIAPVYGYDADEKNYFGTSVILPGRGYWILSEVDTVITLTR